MMKFLIFLGLRLWKNNGYWIDKENNTVQTNYKDLPLLGKIGVNLMLFGFKHDKKLNQKFKSMADKKLHIYFSKADYEKYIAEMLLINHLKYGKLTREELTSVALFLYCFSVTKRKLLIEIPTKQ